MTRISILIKTFLLSLAGLAVLTSLSAAQEKKRALLIGVAKYEKAGFNDLDYPEDDVKSLKEVLEGGGFEVTLMLGSLRADNPLRASRDNIAHQLLSLSDYRSKKANGIANLQPGFVAQLGSLNKSDIVLVAIAGHGRQKLVAADNLKQETPYYCPVDALQSDETTWISISDLMKQVSTCSGSQNNLILVDACRDNPSRGRGIDGARVTLPGDNLAIFFSSSSGTEAYEAKQLGHGIFTHFVLEGLKGEAANRRDQVTWDALVGYVRTSVSEEAPKLVERVQLPNAIGNVKGASPVLIGSVKSRTPVVPTEPSPPKTGNESTITNSIGMNFQRIEAGKFLMGSTTGADDEKPVHEVAITKPYYLGIYEVTQAQWNTVMKDKQSPWKGLSNTIEGDDVAASSVSWDGAQEFIAKLNGMESSMGRHYRLPTEAEWEYACRAGSKTEFSFGDDEKDLDSYAWWAGGLGDGNAQSEQYAHRVGQKKPNRWGLFDMHGNVWEWCQDWQGDYASGSVVDPSGPATGSFRVLRGGCWFDAAGFCRSANRNGDSPGYRGSLLGFRVSLVPSVQ